MRVFYLSLKWLVTTSFIFCLLGCSSSVDLIQDEIQIFVGQSINASNYLTEEFRNNDDVEIRNKVDTTQPGNFEIEYELNGSRRTLKVTVLESPIDIIKTEVIIETGSHFDPEEYLSSMSQSSEIKIVSNVDINRPGEYTVIYSFNNSEKILDVIVKDVEVTLKQESVSINLGSSFNPKEYLAGDFPTSDKIIIENNVNTQQVGSYKVIYSVGTDSKILYVTVNDVSPFLTTNTISIVEGSEFNPIDYLSNSDKSNSGITITNPVDTKILGTYVVTYKLNEIIKTLSVEVTKAEEVQPQPVNVLKVISLTSPVNAGSNATIVVQGMAGKTYSITVYYKSGASSAAGLDSKKAGSNGRVTWTWKVGAQTSPGEWLIEISGEEDSLETYFVVK